MGKRNRGDHILARNTGQLSPVVGDAHVVFAVGGECLGDAETSEMC